LEELGRRFRECKTRTLLGINANNHLHSGLFQRLLRRSRFDVGFVDHSVSFLRDANIRNQSKENKTARRGRDKRQKKTKPNKNRKGAGKTQRLIL